MKQELFSFLFEEITRSLDGFETNSDLYKLMCESNTTVLCQEILKKFKGTCGWYSANPLCR